MAIAIKIEDKIPDVSMFKRIIIRLKNEPKTICHEVERTEEGFRDWGNPNKTYNIEEVRDWFYTC